MKLLRRLQIWMTSTRILRQIVRYAGWLNIIAPQNWILNGTQRRATNFPRKCFSILSPISLALTQQGVLWLQNEIWRTMRSRNFESLIWRRGPYGDSKHSCGPSDNATTLLSYSHSWIIIGCSLEVITIMVNGARGNSSPLRATRVTEVFNIPLSALGRFENWSSVNAPSSPEHWSPLTITFVHKTIFSFRQITQFDEESWISIGILRAMTLTAFSIPWCRLDCITGKRYPCRERTRWLKCCIKFWICLWRSSKDFQPAGICPYHRCPKLHNSQ